MGTPSLGLKTELPADWKSRFGWVYIVKNDGLYKIGSAKKPHKRIAQLKTAAPFLEPVHHIPSLSYRELENVLHVHYQEKRVAGEWFALTKDDMDFISTIDGEANQLADLRRSISLAKMVREMKEQKRALSNLHRRQ